MAIETGLSRVVRQVAAASMAPSGADIRCVLIKPDHAGTYNSATAAAYVTGMSGDEVSTGAGYTQGGQALTSRTVGDGSSQDVGWVDYGNPVWQAVGALSARGCGFWDATNSRWLGFLDFGATYTATDGPFTVNIPNTGTGFVRA